MKTLFVTLFSLFTFVSVSAMITPDNPPKTQYNDIDNSCRDRGVTVNYEAGGRNIGVNYDKSKTDFNMSVERKDGSRLNYDTRSNSNSTNASSWANSTNRVNKDVDASRIDIKCYDKNNK